MINEMKEATVVELHFLISLYENSLNNNINTILCIIIMYNNKNTCI